MNKHTLALMAATVAFTCSVRAQFGAPRVPAFNSMEAKLFGDNPTFSADVEMQTELPGRGASTIPGKIAHDADKTRFELDLGDAKGGQMNPAMVQQMKRMGMDQTVGISREDKKVYYTIYPGLNAYTETPLQDVGKPDSASKIQTTELGKETVDGHPCIKNKVVITDDQGKAHEFTVWNATDLKKFPVEFQTSDEGRNATMFFKNIKTSKPDPALFDPPADYRKYTDQRQMFQQEIMKRMGVRRVPPGQPPQAH